MANMWQLIFLFLMWIPLSLSSILSFIGSPQQCEKAHFVPGYNLGGEGFDIVTMERKGAYVIDTETWNLGNGTCKMYRNSYQAGVYQKVPVAVTDWRTLPKCTMKVSSTLYDSAEQLTNDSTSSVTNDWKIGLNIPVDPSVTIGVSAGGSHSRASQFGMKKSKEDRYFFARQSINCNFYRYRLTTNPPLSPDFMSAVNALPPSPPSKASSYREVIDTYGTHYITQVYLGGEIKATTAFQTCKATMDGLTATDVSDCLTVEASATFANSASVNAMGKHCEAQKKKLSSAQSFSSEFNERITEVIGGDEMGIVLFESGSDPDVYKNWLNSLKTTPDVVQYNLKPLHMILPDNHHAKNGLKREVEQYIMRNVVLRKCSESCQIGHRSSKRDPCACVCNSNQNIKSNCCPAGKGLATLKVYKLFAKGLYGDTWSETDGSVEVKYGDQLKRTEIISDNDNPRWPEKFDFGPIVINMQNKLKFSVYDEDTKWNRDLLGQCSFDLRRGLVTDTCMFDHGTFYFTYLVECAPSLGGKRCDEYISSPMDPSLTKAFYTRNSVLLGDAMKMFSKPGSKSGSGKL
ncbi:PREDICTED: perforin-1-like isoform X1 [Cyprinodon variegatus]|uniref:perforin-1-like isoform X1 n=1 Tax=Cyprinodon variegatus TaxID=28743 RepID=UPI0007426B44|nr:PREDICTED: perforin-1-like isoform X1 [Cyprinodon variegatus]XP_015231286.1 PREDICTED: perforin-1-like isoform X1 [Cyprinodon variegatus]